MTTTTGSSLARATRRIARIATALLVAGSSASALADDGRGPMLSLGDSVVFGFIEQDGYAYVNPENFLGYPEIAGHALHLDASNPSCPGETSASFLSATAPDNGCHSYRASFPLHESYAGTQMEFARSFLGAHRNTRLITLSLGANDGFLLQAACGGDPACIQAGLPAALAAVYGNLNTILSNLRASGFKGMLMVVNYYSLDYSDPAQTGLTVALNQALAGAAAANGAVVADAFTAFYKVAARPFAAGNTCKSGLLNGSASSATACDDHPSLTGQRLLARTVQAAYLGARRAGD
ncbi:GDSL-type esterase/lipase family protein [Roseateles saccharophilus]|uniref:GDSL-like lipase/acylhydrolase family protein n=1 Tax=Roseateles saccharophilus TaxID=304 RepID=A0A4R3V1P9_ROSSA|nr:GDSL-type esterase/lipase family protein [Roseateles saccharophilus]MDG0832413.1 SGNH/GDSL hydrolase family protein [Roseateles saccharophilus]TCU97108.1 GDSL-like lipase/acylhydrolase family protein [Roseateles saccharophilus]